MTQEIEEKKYTQINQVWMIIIRTMLIIIKEMKMKVMKITKKENNKINIIRRY